MYVCMLVCLSVCMYLCMYSSMCVMYLYMYVYNSVPWHSHCTTERLERDGFQAGAVYAVRSTRCCVFGEREGVNPLQKRDPF